MGLSRTGKFKELAEKLLALPTLCTCPLEGPSRGIPWAGPHHYRCAVMRREQLRQRFIELVGSKPLNKEDRCVVYGKPEFGVWRWDRKRHLWYVLF